MADNNIERIELGELNFLEIQAYLSEHRKPPSKEPTSLSTLLSSNPANIETNYLAYLRSRYEDAGLISPKAQAFKHNKEYQYLTRLICMLGLTSEENTETAGRLSAAFTFNTKAAKNFSIIADMTPSPLGVAIFLQALYNHPDLGKSQSPSKKNAEKKETTFLSIGLGIVSRLIILHSEHTKKSTHRNTPLNFSKLSAILNSGDLDSIVKLSENPILALFSDGTVLPINIARGQDESYEETLGKESAASATTPTKVTSPNGCDTVATESKGL